MNFKRISKLTAISIKYDVPYEELKLAVKKFNGKIKKFNINYNDLVEIIARMSFISKENPVKIGSGLYTVFESLNSPKVIKFLKENNIKIKKNQKMANKIKCLSDWLKKLNETEFDIKWSIGIGHCSALNVCDIIFKE